MRKVELLSVAVSCFALWGCGSRLRPEDPNMALLNGYSKICSASLLFGESGQEPNLTRAELHPGRQHLVVHYHGEPAFYADQAAYKLCVPESRHEIEFEAKAGQTYWFRVDEQTEHRHVLEVWEANEPGGISSHRLDVHSTQLEAGRNCFNAGHYSGCARLGYPL